MHRENYDLWLLRAIDHLRDSSTWDNFTNSNPRLLIAEIWGFFRRKKFNLTQFLRKSMNFVCADAELKKNVLAKKRRRRCDFLLIPSDIDDVECKHRKEPMMLKVGWSRSWKLMNFKKRKSRLRWCQQQRKKNRFSSSNLRDDVPFREEDASF